MTSRRVGSRLRFGFQVTAAAMIAVCCITGFARGQCEQRWVQTNGPYGGSIYSLAIDPLTPSTLYAGTAWSSRVFLLESDSALHFSQFGNGLGFTSDVVLTNPSPSATVSGTITSADDNGLPLSVGLDTTSGTDFSILPLGARTLSTDGLGELVVGSAVVTADGALGGVVRFSIPGIGIAGVGASEPMNGFITPVRRAAGGINTGVALSNAEAHAVTLDLTLRNQQGQEVPGGHRTIENFPARGHLARFIDELFPEAQINDFEGTLVVQAEAGAIAATALELGASPGQFTTLPVTPLTAVGTAAELSFAQFGSGGGFTSDTVLVNPWADGPVSGTLTLLDDEGQPMPVGLAGSGLQSSRAFSIPPLGVVTISTDGSGSLSVGSARVSADGPLGGVVRFHIPGIGIAGVGASRPLGRLLIPVRRTAGGIGTGIALQNTGDAPVTIALRLRDTTGTPVPGGTATLNNLAAHGHLARFVEELFPEASTQNFQGTLSVEVTEGTVAATALEFGSRPGEFTTLPVTPVGDNPPPSCTYALDPRGWTHEAVKGVGSFAVTTTAGCAWTATTSGSWIHITAGGGGTGSGRVSYGIDANATAASRQGAITVSGVVYAITQNAGTGGTTGPHGIEFVSIPAGEFMMGSDSSQADSDEPPVHRVRITRAFQLGKYEITQAQWRAVTGNDPSNFKGDNRPVERVSWDEVQGFLARLNALGDGYRYRLPTEAEWEYACRAGTTTEYYWGDTIDGAYAWYWDNSGSQTHDVGQKKPNAWGLYDMLGNVWEWCQDWYLEWEYYYSSTDDPLGPGSGSYRVLRGGSWYDCAPYVRSANRNYGWPDKRGNYFGFRLLRSG